MTGVLPCTGTTQAASNQTIQALLAYHIVPGLYGGESVDTELQPAASNIVATELATLLASPSNVTVATATNNTVVRLLLSCVTCNV